MVGDVPIVIVIFYLHDVPDISVGNIGKVFFM